MSFFHKGVSRNTHSHSHTQLGFWSPRPGYRGDGCPLSMERLLLALWEWEGSWQPGRGSGLCQPRCSRQRLLHRPRGLRQAKAGVCALWWRPGPVVGQGEPGPVCAAGRKAIVPWGTAILEK